MGGIAQTLFNVIKLMAVIAVCAVFMLAISNILGLVEQIVFGGIISETMALVSMYLPFNASVVFGGVFAVASAILSFMLARKIFDLTSWGISSV